MQMIIVSSNKLNECTVLFREAVARAAHGFRRPDAGLCADTASSMIVHRPSQRRHFACVAGVAGPGLIAP